MKRLLIALVCLVCSAAAFAQTADEPATRDDIMLYLRTMRSHDMMVKTMQVQMQSVQQLLQAQILKEKGSLPADFETRMKAMMDDLVKSMPIDEITQAMIPAYQKHFTKGDIEAMNAFYSSPVGQKVLEVLPAVMQDGMQAAMPLMSNYLSDWMERMKKQFDTPEKNAPAKAGDPPPPAQN